MPSASALIATDLQSEMDEMSIRNLALAALDFVKEVSILILIGMASSVVFVLLLLLVGPSWQAAVGAGIFIGFVSLFSVFCLPFTGIASTTCSALALVIYVVASSVAGFPAPFWVALAVVSGGFVLLPAIAAVAVLIESRRA